jgi:Spy/CpxP family protein refolding chaperone
MKTLTVLKTLPMFGLIAMLAACSGTANDPGTGSATSAVVSESANGSSANVATGSHHRGMHHRGGPEGLLFAALHHDIGLSDAQKTTIQGLVDGLKPQKGAHQEDATRRVALANAVRAGSVDVAAFPRPEPPAAVKTAHQDALAKALDTLHATLTPDQRTALVAAMSKHEGGEHGQHRMGDRAKWQGEREAMGPKGEHGFGPMGMLKGIDLTDAQKTTIETNLQALRPAKPSDAEITAMKARHEEMKKDREAKLQSFVGDSFDAVAFVARPVDAKPEMNRGDHMMKELAVIVPVLSPAQRELLASRIEQGPKAHDVEVR